MNLRRGKLRYPGIGKRGTRHEQNTLLGLYSGTEKSAVVLLLTRLVAP